MSESLKQKIEQKTKTFPDMIEENSQCCKGFLNGCCDCKELCGTENWVRVDGVVAVLDEHLLPLINLLTTNKLKPVCDFNPSIDFCLRVEDPKRWKALWKCVNCEIRIALKAVLDGEAKP